MLETSKDLLLVVIGTVVLSIFSIFLVGCIKQGTNQQLSLAEVSQKICSDEGSDIKIWKCGEYYKTYPTGYQSKEERETIKEADSKLIIMDADTHIYSSDGNYIMSCGGYKAYASEANRKKEQEECAKYTADNCEIIKESCFD